MIKDLSIVNKLWLESSVKLGLNPEMGTQYTEMRKAFYAGVSSLLVFQHKELTEIDDEKGVDCLQMMIHEIARFWEHECERYNKTEL